MRKAKNMTTAPLARHNNRPVLVMSLEIAVLAIEFYQVKSKASNKWHGKLTKTLFPIWWFAFLSGKTVYHYCACSKKGLYKKRQ